MEVGVICAAQYSGRNSQPLVSLTNTSSTQPSSTDLSGMGQPRDWPDRWPTPPLPFPFLPLANVAAITLVPLNQSPSKEVM